MLKFGILVAMFIEIITLIKDWGTFAQFLFAMGIASFITGICLVVLGSIGDFFNISLPILVRGYNPYSSDNKNTKQSENLED